MSDPFKIDGPTCISFSGGRTSAYMLWRVLQSNGGLPPDAIVCFANTGKEDEATLRFVRDCSVNWNVPITWVEYRPDAPGYAVVDFETASRNGEPFEAIIRKRNYLPNPVTRFCTVELKIRAIAKLLKAKGWLERRDDGNDEGGTQDGSFLRDGVDMFIGIRADEQRRVRKIRAGRNSESVSITKCMPLADAGVTIADISAFWDAQPFRLELPTVNGKTLAGNCDLCFLKAGNQVRTLIAQQPERAIWWAKMESTVTTKHIRSVIVGWRPSTSSELAESGDDEQPVMRDVLNKAGALFRSDRASYQAMLDNARDQVDFIGYEDEGIDCFCGD